MAATTAPPYWCHSCDGFVDVRRQSSIRCLDCPRGFVEQRHPNPNQNSIPRVCRNSRNHPEQSIDSPISVLCQVIHGGGSGANYELYYGNFDSGLRSLPDSVAQLLMRTGFHHLLDQVTQLDVNDSGMFEISPAAKADKGCVVDEPDYCSVCREAFKVNSEARELLYFFFAFDSKFLFRLSP